MSIAARLAACRGRERPAAPPAADAFSSHHGRGRAAPGREPEGAAVAAALHELVGRPLPAPVFFDLETTGLGADAVPFLVGLGGFDDDGRAWVRQWQLDAPDGERALWLEVIDALRAGGGVVTFNGKSFDRTITRMRLRRLGLWSPALEASFGAGHVDLLPMCRRLWRGALPDVRLVTLEREVLGAARHDDPAGHEIAELGARWVRGHRDAELQAAMERVRRHNADDLLGLASLVVACAAAMRAPRGPAQALAVARAWAQRGEPQRALALARQFSAGRAEPARLELLLLRARLAAQQGARDEAHVLLQEICACSPGHPVAAVRLAIDCEHRLRRPELALAWLRSTADPCPRRLARLQRKLGAATPADARAGAEVTAAPPGPMVAAGGAIAVPGTWRRAGAPGAAGSARRV